MSVEKASITIRLVLSRAKLRAGSERMAIKCAKVGAETWVR